NPTRVTEINGPGAGISGGAPGLKLSYGHTDAGTNATDANHGQLLSLVNANGTIQTNDYQRGFLIHANFGFGQPSTTAGHLQDAFFVRGPTGEPIESAPCSYVGTSRSAHPSCGSGGEPADDTLPQVQPATGGTECGWGSCQYEPDADGQARRVCKDNCVG